ncbi:hypothetical protein J2Z50_004902 [Ensifer mexicanus]|nr:hypothetical protein [Sinorhizobium mexicanum]
MVKSNWVCRSKLRNFRAGIEAGISCLKRTYGLAGCTWRGLDHFKSYIWSPVVAYNLVLLTRLKPWCRPAYQLSWPPADAGRALGYHSTTVPRKPAALIPSIPQDDADVR